MAASHPTSPLPYPPMTLLFGSTNSAHSILPLVAGLSDAVLLSLPISLLDSVFPSIMASPTADVAR